MKTQTMSANFTTEMASFSSAWVLVVGSLCHVKRKCSATCIHKHEVIIIERRSWYVTLQHIFWITTNCKAENVVAVSISEEPKLISRGENCDNSKHAFEYI